MQSTHACAADIMQESSPGYVLNHKSRKKKITQCAHTHIYTHTHTDLSTHVRTHMHACTSSSLHTLRNNHCMNTKFSCYSMTYGWVKQNKWNSQTSSKNCNGCSGQQWTNCSATDKRKVVTDCSHSKTHCLCTKPESCSRPSPLPVHFGPHQSLQMPTFCTKAATISVSHSYSSSKVFHIWPHHHHQVSLSI